MQLSEIDINKYTTIERVHPFNEFYGTRVFHDDQYYFKLWGIYTPTFFEQDGLDLIWVGREKLATIKRNMVTPENCCAFKELIFHEGICRGYVMHKGTHPAHDVSRDTYIKFVDTLVKISLETGYGFVDVHQYNMITYKGKLSLIDLNFSPIKLRHSKKFSPIELELWYETFASKDNIYLDKLRKHL